MGKIMPQVVKTDGSNLFPLSHTGLGFNVRPQVFHATHRKMICLVLAAQPDCTLAGEHVEALFVARIRMSSRRVVQVGVERLASFVVQDEESLYVFTSQR